MKLFPCKRWRNNFQIKEEDVNKKDTKRSIDEEKNYK
jgi:hypothetical protein